MKRVKKLGRPTKKTSGGANIKTYRNKRSYLSKINKSISSHGGPSISLPRIPQVITEGSINALSNMIIKANTTRQYYTLREDLEVILTSLGLEEELPDVPKTITKGSVRRLNRLMDKYSQYVTEEDEEEIEEPEPEPEEPFEDEIIATYRDFISMAYDSAFAEDKFHELSGYDKSFTSVHDKVIEHANNCMGMLERIGAFDNEHKKQVAKALMAKASEIYNKTERYLFFYHCLFDDRYGMEILQEVEEALTTQTGETFTEEQRKDYAKILSDYGDYFEDYYGEM